MRCFIHKTTALITDIITPNENISFPIETILTAQRYYDHLNISRIFGKHKSRGRNINSLIEAPVSYKLTENQSVTKAANQINRKEVLFEIYENARLASVAKAVTICQMKNTGYTGSK